MTYYFPPSSDDPDALDSGEGLENGFEYLDLEHNELDRRLRHLTWPAPPEGVRERCLQAVFEQRGLRPPSAPPVNPEPPDARAPRPDRVRRHEHVQWHEVSRRRHDVLAERVMSAPRRQPRFASAL